MLHDGHASHSEGAKPHPRAVAAMELAALLAIICVLLVASILVALGAVLHAIP
jgi:hypothetical protein